jgi:hypothetical protein
MKILPRRSATKYKFFNMKRLIIFLIFLTFCGQVAVAQSKTKLKNKQKKPSAVKKSAADFSVCLPEGITSETVVSAENLGFDNVKRTFRIASVNVKEKLTKLGAKCAAGNLTDAGGKGIKFYRLQGCWGNPPVNYQEILSNQAKELADLRKRFTVVELTCNPSGIPLP